MAKISDDELQQVKQNREKVLEISQQLSELVLQQTLLEEQLKSVKQLFIDSVNKEQFYLQNLNETYGEGLLDINTGEIKTT